MFCFSFFLFHLVFRPTKCTQHAYIDNFKVFLKKKIFCSFAFVSGLNRFIFGLGCCEKRVKSKKVLLFAELISISYHTFEYFMDIMGENEVEEKSPTTRTSYAMIERERGREKFN